MVLPISAATSNIRESGCFPFSPTNSPYYVLKAVTFFKKLPLKIYPSPHNTPECPSIQIESQIEQELDSLVDGFSDLTGPLRKKEILFESFLLVCMKNIKEAEG